MDQLEFLLWLVGIVLIGIPLVFISIPCITAVIVFWRLDK